jgi:hypothetical protein
VQTGLQTAVKKPIPSVAPPRPAKVDLTSSATRFEYVGRNGLTARGAVTGRTYRFNFSGDQIVVDRRDAASLLAVPKLRKLK